MCHHPCLQLIREGREDVPKLWITGCEGLLTDADAKACAQCRELGQVTVGAKAEIVCCDWKTRGSERPNDRGLAVVADQAARGDHFLQTEGLAIPSDPRFVCVKSEW